MASTGLPQLLAENGGKCGDSNISAIERMNVTMDMDDNPPPEELNARVATLFNQIFAPEPAVDASQVSLQHMSGAKSNYVYMMTIDPAPIVPTAQAPRMMRASVNNQQQETTLMPRKYILRVYGAGLDEILSREKELYWLSQLAPLGIGAPIYSIFGNGRIEEYLESTTLTKDDNYDSSTSKHIAQRMSELHTLVSHYHPYGSGNPNSKEAVYLNGQPELWASVDAWMQLVQSKWQEVRRKCDSNAQCAEILDKWPVLVQAVRKYKTHVEQEAHSPIVFAHNDMQNSNILRLDRTGELVIIDFEYAGYNYRGFDIANHLRTWMNSYDPSRCLHYLDLTQYPTVEQRRGFMQAYVRTKAFIDDNVMAGASVVKSGLAQPAEELHPSSLSKDRICEEAEALDREVAFFLPASYMYWGVWGLLQACSSVTDIDYTVYSAQRLSMFLEYVAKIK
ncbi:hypothetical protein LPJ59_005087 [Coemansia sp. RSA 2399]|nr:hypothetical protein LPJ59_005087 [Coemansia sp. RSA 2399]KAJ1895701.1 hypothetical protein LPJ81_004903 [Coemansia sp. IMI 209127]